MAQTPLSLSAAYILTPAGVTAGQLDKAFAASDSVNGNSFVSSGKDMLIAYNTDMGAQTFGIQSAPDQFGRFANITYSMAAGAFAAVIITSASIYTQPSGLVLLTSSSANVKFLVIQGA